MSELDWYAESLAAADDTDTLGARCSGDRSITRAEADEDAERPWSRELWLRTGNGYY